FPWTTRNRYAPMWRDPRIVLPVPEPVGRSGWHARGLPSDYRSWPAGHNRDPAARLPADAPYPPVPREAVPESVASVQGTSASGPDGVPDRVRGGRGPGQATGPHGGALLAKR